MKALRSASILAVALGLAVALSAGTKTPTGYQVYPTRNDVATSTGDGRNFREETMAPALANFYQQNFTASGLTAGAASSTLSLTFTPGVCYINGFYVHLTVATEVDLTGSTVNCTYIELPTTSGLVSAMRFNTNTTCQPPSTNSYLVASSTASSSSVTASVNSMPPNPYLPPYSNAVVLTITTSSGVWFPPAGLTSVFVEMVGGGAGGSGVHATWSTGGVGGGGGYQNDYIYQLTPGSLIRYGIATGGAGGVGAASGSAGSGKTWFYDTNKFFANNAPAGSGPNVGADGVSGTGQVLSYSNFARGYSFSGFSGNSVFAIPGATAASEGDGSPGTYGAGGGGAATATATSHNGGKGGDGILIIHY